MAYTTINKSTDHFNTLLYTGDGASSKAITGVGFQPDWVWIKNRAAAEAHSLYDAVRGTQKVIFTSSTGAESTETNGLSSFDSNGFTVGFSGAINGNSQNIASWNWKANGQGSSNSDGTINSTYTSANTTSGFSIVSYTGTGSAGTVGHGLGTTPSMVWIFNRTDGGNAHVYHKALGSTQYLLHASILAAQTYAPVGIGTLTSTTFSVGTVSGVNGSGKNYVAYVFAEKQGFSKIGSYTGNGNSDGTFVYTGFRPAWVLIKNISSSQNWIMFDNKRSGFNVIDDILYPNQTDAEGTQDSLDFLSNGFKLRVTGNDRNQSGSTLIYMAFAEAPLVGSNNIPAVAR